MLARFRYAAFFALLLVGQLTHAIGLGDAQLRSHFGSPLDLSIPVHHVAGMTGDDFRIALTAMNDAVSGSPLDTMVGSKYQVSYDPETESIRLRSDESIVEPYLAFTLVLRWPQGFLKRDYTVLLDFPEFHRTEPVSRVAKNAGEAASGKSAKEQSTASYAVDSAPTHQALPSQKTSQKPESTSVAQSTADIAEQNHYRVQRGDSLWGLASDLSRQREGNRAQWMATLFQENPKAFMGGQPGRLKEAYLLFVPATCSDTRMVLGSGGSGGYLLVYDQAEQSAVADVAVRETAPVEASPEVARPQPVQPAEAADVPVLAGEQVRPSFADEGGLASEASPVDQGAAMVAESVSAAKQGMPASAAQVEQALLRVEELERQLAKALALMAQQEQQERQAQQATPSADSSAQVFTAAPILADMSGPAYLLHSIGWLSVGMLLVLGYMLYRDRRASKVRLRRLS